MEQLPQELLTHIALLLPTLQDIGRSMLVNSQWCSVVCDPVTMKKLQHRFGVSTLYIQDLTGRQTAITYNNATTVGTVKQRYQDLKGIPPDQQLCIFAGKWLYDNDVVSQRIYGNGGVVHLVLGLGRQLPDTTVRP